MRDLYMGKSQHISAARSEADFICHAMKAGWEIATPFANHGPYDYLVRRSIHEGWKMVQVKTAYMEKQSSGYSYLCISLRRSAGSKGARWTEPYKEGDFDLLFVTDLKNRWLLPWSAVCHIKSTIHMNKPALNQYRV